MKSQPVFPIYRGAEGVVLTCHPLAATAGMQVLSAGGNAIDAAIAATWVEMVTLPMATGLGGDVLAMVCPPGDDPPMVLLGLGQAPLRASVDALDQRGMRALPKDGLYSASLPRAVDALEALRERFAKLPRQRLMASAIRYAGGGFPLSARGARLFVKARILERANPELLRVLAPSGLPKAGTMIYQPELASTLEEVADSGRSGFYQGPFAAALLEYSEAEQAWFGPDDLAVAPAPWAEPMRLGDSAGESWDWFSPAPSSGVVVAIARAFLGAVGPGASQAQSMTRLARARAVGTLLRHDPGVLAGLAAGAPPHDWPEGRRWLGFVTENAPPPAGTGFGGGTSLVACQDRDGWQVAVMHSLSGLDFGSALMIPGTGVVLNSRLGRGATLDGAAPHRLRPGMTPDSTLTLVARYDREGGRLVGGTPGGDQQSLWDLVLLAGLDRGAAIAEVVAGPRWHDTGDGRTLVSEDRLSAPVRQELAETGWQIETIGPWQNTGGYQLVWSDSHRGYGVGDPRIEGGAAAG